VGKRLNKVERCECVPHFTYQGSGEPFFLAPPRLLSEGIEERRKRRRGVGKLCANTGLSQQ